MTGAGDNPRELVRARMHKFCQEKSKTNLTAEFFAELARESEILLFAAIEILSHPTPAHHGTLVYSATPPETMFRALMQKECSEYKAEYLPANILQTEINILNMYKQRISPESRFLGLHTASVESFHEEEFDKSDSRHASMHSLGDEMVARFLPMTITETEALIVKFNEYKTRSSIASTPSGYFGAPKPPAGSGSDAKPAPKPPGSSSPSAGS